MHRSVFNTQSHFHFHLQPQFYRYTPTSRREDRKLAFLVPGVTVNINRSNERDVLLQDVQKSSAGLYRCEVSVEGTFKSVSVEKTMSVAEASEVAGSNQRNHQRSRQAIQAQSNRANAKASNHITSMLEPSTQGQHKPSSAAASSQLIPGTSFIHLVILCKVLTLLWPALYMTQQHHHQQVTTGNGKR